MDSLPGVFLTFILGFSLNFLQAEISIRGRRQGIAVSLLALLALLQWQLYLDNVYWTGHRILVLWPPLIAIPIAALVYFFSEATSGVAVVGAAITGMVGPRQFWYLSMALSGNARAGFIISPGMGFAARQLADPSDFSSRHAHPSRRKLLCNREAADGLGREHA